MEDELRLALRLRAPGTRIVVSFWGSDLLRRSKATLRRMRRLLTKADVITVSSRGMEERLRETCTPLTADVVRIPFGVNGFEAIDALRASADATSCRRAFGVAREDDIVVVLGYNGRPEQQHAMMLAAVAKLPEKQLEKLHVILPMTYGGEEAYVRQVASALSGIDVRGIVLRDFLGAEEQARLCLAADVFVHAQISDALSASMQEFLYAGALVLSGSWLRYPELEEDGVTFMTYQDDDELRALLLEVGNRGERAWDAPDGNRTLLRVRSWSSVAAGWRELYGVNALG